MAFKDVQKQLNDNRMKMWKAETEKKAWDKKSGSEKKKWTEEFVRFNVEAWEDVYKNALELQEEMETLKQLGKKSVDALEELIEKKRRSPGPLTSEERGWLANRDIFDTYAKQIEELFTQAAACSPAMVFRGEYFKDLVSNGAITTAEVTAIKKVRIKGIDLAEEFSATGKARIRMLEYPKRWETLMAELANANKVALGQGAQVEKEVLEKLAKLAKDFTSFTGVVDLAVNKINDKLPKAMKMLDKKSPSGFLDSVRQVMSEKYSAEREKELFNDMVGVRTNLGLALKALKDAKGMVKTKQMEFTSLRSQVGKDKQLNEKFSKTLEQIQKKFEELDTQLDELKESMSLSAEIVEAKFGDPKN